MFGVEVQGFLQKWGWLLLLGGGVFVAGYLLFGRKNAKSMSGSSTTSLLPGASTQPGSNGQPVVQYVPTTGDSYTNVNYTTDSNNINKTQNNTSNNTVNSNNNTTTTPPTPPPGPQPQIMCPRGYHKVTINGRQTCVKDPPIPGPPPGPPPPKPPPPPPPTPNPPKPPPQPQFKSVTVQPWPAQFSTLSGIASANHTTWQTLYNINKSEIDRVAAAMGNPIPGGPWNNLRPGEVIMVPA